MQIEKGEDGLRVTGRLDFATVPDFLDRAETVFGAKSSCRLDLARLEHVDSAGIAALLWLKRRLGDSGRTLDLVNLPEQGRAMADVAGVMALLQGR